MSARPKTEKKQQRAVRLSPASFYAAGPLLSLTRITVDRLGDRAIFLTLGLTIPSVRIISPLSMIVGAQVIKGDQSEPDYSIKVRLYEGNHIRFACRTRAIAMATYQALRHHLPVETR